MITAYIQKALVKAHYEILKDDQTIYGEIRECPGVYANSETVEGCRRELQEILEEWLLLRIYKNLDIPTIDGVSIKISKEVVA